MTPWTAAQQQFVGRTIAAADSQLKTKKTYSTKIAIFATIFLLRSYFEVKISNISRILLQNTRVSTINLMFKWEAPYTTNRTENDESFLFP